MTDRVGKAPLELFGVHVTGLQQGITENDLRQLFSPAGKIKKIKIINKGIGAGKTVAFINFFDEDSQRKATRLLHEKPVQGRKLNVTKLTQDPSEIKDVYVSGHPQNATNEELREMLEEICQIPCVRVTNKGPYCFYQVEGEENYYAAMKALNGAVTRTGHQLVSQPSRRKTTYTKDKTRLAEAINALAAQNGILPSMDTAEMYLLERSIRTVHISSLPQSITEDMVKEKFEEFGEVEDVNIVCKAGYTTGYGFIVFTKHSTIQDFRKRNIKTIFINNCAVRVSSSKPTKRIVDNALMAGLLDIDYNPTSLFFGLLESAQSQLASAGPAGANNNLMYLQDPSSGQIYAVTPEQYQQLLQRQQQQQPGAPSQQPPPRQQAGAPRGGPGMHQPPPHQQQRPMGAPPAMRGQQPPRQPGYHQGPPPNYHHGPPPPAGAPSNYRQPPPHMINGPPPHMQHAYNQQRMPPPYFGQMPQQGPPPPGGIPPPGSRPPHAGGAPPSNQPPSQQQQPQQQQPSPQSNSTAGSTQQQQPPPQTQPGTPPKPVAQMNGGGGPATPVNKKFQMRIGGQSGAPPGKPTPPFMHRGPPPPFHQGPPPTTGAPTNSPGQGGATNRPREAGASRFGSNFRPY